MFDAIVIGAGLTGLYQLHLLREAGMTVRVFEAASGVGGTWYWNRYPGCRFDSESHTYGYSFSEEILQEWDWTEHFSGQPENLRYAEFVADKLDLRRDISFESRVRSATWDDDGGRWRVQLEGGEQAEARYLITALGIVSTPNMPIIAGMDSFDGPSHHTGLWPKEPVGFTGKRVAVIGTGASGVQVIQEIAKTATSLTVYQRTPNWCAPLGNRLVTDEEQRHIKANYPEIFERCKRTFAHFIHDSDKRNALDATPEQRDELWEALWSEPGFGIWMANFRDVLVDDDANRLLSDFVAAKIRERVDDPVTAEKLIPTDHGFGTRRVPLETGYYEVYNQDNVTLVDIRETPIERITPVGIRTADGIERAFDLIVYATGFDAVTGAFDRIEFNGIGGVTLREAWANGPYTYLGLAVPGFPNFFTLVGPHNAAGFCNLIRCSEQNVAWLSALLRHANAGDVDRIEALQDAARSYTERVLAMADRMLFSKTSSWFTGRNSGTTKPGDRRVLLYAGGMPGYTKTCDEVAADGYVGFDLRPARIEAL